MFINETQTNKKYPYSNLYKNKKNYIKTEKYIKKFEFKINEIINWLLDVFKVEKLSAPMFANELGEIKIIHIWNMIIFFAVKIFPLYVFLIYYSTNVYYAMYFEKNDNTCEQFQKNEDIIKLDNGNIFIISLNPTTLEETECKRNLTKIKILN